MLDQISTLEDLDASGRRVLVRADLNVPLRDGEVVDDLRLRGALPTLRHLIDVGANITLCSHLGRPAGEPVPELSLRPVAERLGQLLDRKVYFSGDIVGDAARQTTGALAPGEVALLENLRFDPGERANADRFVTDLTWFGDAYVNDAFGAAHRSHASVVGVAERLPAVAGRLLVTEIEVLNRLLVDPPRPYVAVLGGAKIADKLAVLHSLLERVDTLVVGGAMCFTFLASQGLEVGDSRVEEDRVDEIRTLVKAARDRGVEIHLPSDIVVAPEFDPDAAATTVDVDAMPGDQLGLDIGPETTDGYADTIRRAGSVFWNGPMGVFEWEAFSGGTSGVARAMAETSAFTVVGGGDSAAAVRSLDLDAAFDHVSTGGGAALALLEGADLPGLRALRQGSGRRSSTN